MARPLPKVSLIYNKVNWPEAEDRRQQRSPLNVHPLFHRRKSGNRSEREDSSPEKPSRIPVSYITEKEAARSSSGQ